jgi:hypothetical protein
MPNIRVSLTSHKTAVRQIDYLAIRHYVKTKLPFGILDE